jgi:glycosyltransferase involved in cell wall biosynthesis
MGFSHAVGCGGRKIGRATVEIENSTYVMSQQFRPPLAWILRRWRLKQLWYRVRLPVRRRRWVASRERLLRHYVKAASVARSSGRALVIGDFSGSDGLSQAAIYDFEKIKSHHIETLTLDIGPYLKGRAGDKPHFEGAIENVYFLCQPDTYELAVGLLNPASLSRAYRIGRWAWETTVFPEDWRFAEALLHEVWVPSTFCARVFRPSLAIPVHVVPHQVKIPPRPAVSIRSRFDVSEGSFLGLGIMDIRSCPERKNPWAYVRAWKAAFQGNENAILLLKLRTGKRSEIVVQELKELIGGDQNIRLVVEELPRSDLDALLHCCDLFLSLHRSEGYGLGIHEALLCGKTVLATDWSAVEDYARGFANYVPISYSLIPYRDWTGHYPQRNFQWADANVAHVATELKKAFGAQQN